VAYQEELHMFNYIKKEEDEEEEEENVGRAKGGLV
jgi:hypothetical protein